MAEYGLWFEGNPRWRGELSPHWLAITKGVVFHTSSLGLAKAQLKSTQNQFYQMWDVSIRTFDDPNVSYIFWDVCVPSLDPPEERADGFPLDYGDGEKDREILNRYLRGWGRREGPCNTYSLHLKTATNSP